jgi:hypothetical protein
MSAPGKRTFKVLRRRSDVEGRADMARTLPDGDRVTPLTCFTQNGWCRLPTRGRGRLRFMVALAAPLPGTTYAGTRWTTLGYPEKVRSQVLSLRQLAQGRVFSGQPRWQFGPVAVAVSNLSSGLPPGRNCPLFSERPVSLRTSGLHLDSTVLGIRSFRATY